MLLFFMALYILLITPLSLQLTLAAQNDVLPTGSVTFFIWGIGVRLDFAVNRDAEGVLQIKLHLHEGKKEKKGDIGKTYKKIKRIWDTLRTADRARALLSKTTHLDTLDFLAVIGGSDAAGTALITGVLTTLLGAIPQHHNMHLRALADFRSRHTGFRLRCILHTRLGNLLLGTILAFSAYQKVKKASGEEKKSWKIIRSAA